MLLGCPPGYVHCTRSSSRQQAPRTCCQLCVRKQSRAQHVCKAEAQPLSYKQAGVDIDAGAELVRRIQKINPSIGGFSGLVPFGKANRDRT